MQEVRGAGIKRGCETLDLGKGEPWRVDASWGGGVFSTEKGGTPALGCGGSGDGKGRTWSICSEPEASGASDRDGLNVGIAGRGVGRVDLGCHASEKDREVVDGTAVRERVCVQ